LRGAVSGAALQSFLFFVTLSMKLVTPGAVEVKRALLQKIKKDFRCDPG
jgi:hypothetical protein